MSQTAEFDVADLKAIEEGGSTDLSKLSTVEYLPECSVEDFPPHRFAELLPNLSPEELGMLLESVKRQGFRKPIILWNHKNRNWVLDGRHRRQVFLKLLEDKFAPEGWTLALPVQWFLGDEKEAIEYVRNQEDGRQMMPSQKAAYAYLSDVEYLKMFKGKGRKRHTGGDWAEMRAIESGCNRTSYIFCKTLAEEGFTDLLQKILHDPEYTCNKAKRDRDARKALAIQKGNADNPTPEDGQEQDPVHSGEETPPAIKVKDGLGEIVPEEWNTVFLLRSEIGECKKVLSAFMQRIEATVALTGGKHLPGQNMLAGLEKVKKDLDDGQPHVICPDCGGEGKMEVDGKKRKCNSCSGFGYLSKALYSAWKKAKKRSESSNDQPTNGGVPVVTEQPTTEELVEIENETHVDRTE